MSSIAILKRQAEVAADNSYSLKSWIETARKTHAAVSAANDQLPHDLAKADSETLEQAYVGYMKWAGIMSIIINHPEYKQTMLDKAGSNWFAYQQLREGCSLPWRESKYSRHSCNSVSIRTAIQ